MRLLKKRKNNQLLLQVICEKLLAFLSSSLIFHTDRKRINRKNWCKMLLQTINGKFNLRFFGFPIKLLGALFFVSKTVLEGKNSDAHVYAFHITPFFSFGFTLPKKKPLLPAPIIINNNKCEAQPLAHTCSVHF